MSERDMMTVLLVAAAAYLLMRYASGQGAAQAAGSVPSDWVASGSQQDQMLASQWPG